MKIEVLPALAGLDEASWNGLLDRSAKPSVFLTWQWQNEWTRAFAADRVLSILTARSRDGSLVGILPLYEDTARRLRLLGGLDVSAYRKLLRSRHGVVIGGGQGKMGGKLIRVGHLGAVAEGDIVQVLWAMERALEELDVAPADGRAVEAATTQLATEAAGAAV